MKDKITIKEPVNQDVLTISLTFSALEVDNAGLIYDISMKKEIAKEAERILRGVKLEILDYIRNGLKLEVAKQSFSKTQ